MKRLILTAAVALGLTLPVLASGAIPQPIYFWSDVAATISGPGQPPAPEVVRPSGIGLFADGSWDVDHLRWTGWGSSVAHATGISSASNGIPNMAQGKRIKTPAQVTLSNPGRFQGREVYRCFTLTVPSHPASDQHLCLKRIGSVWVLGATTQATPGAARTSAEFFVAGGSCSMGANPPLVVCESPSAGGLRVTLAASGQVKICRGQSATTNSCDVGNPGLHTPTLKYGKQITVGPFRCSSARAGVTCVVIKSGRGFLMNKTNAIKVGP